MFVLRWICFLMFFSVQVAFAQEFRRQVNLDWEALEGATAYDVEITSGKKQKAFNFKSKTPEWQGQLTPGKYGMRLRGRDYRGVPGEWSPVIPFVVGLDPVTLIKPSAQAEIKAKEEGKIEIGFDWAPTHGAKKYVLDIKGQGTDFAQNLETSETHVKIEVPAGQKFTWTVTAVFDEEIKSEKNEERSFSLLAKKIENPKLAKPENDFVREVKWSQAEYAESYDVVVQRFDQKKNQWVEVKKFESVKSTSVPFDLNWPGGKYRAAVTAKGENRVGSDTVSMQFPVRRGSRTPAAEYVATVRQSIDRVNGMYAIASYMITQVGYSAQSMDSTFGAAFTALAGTGRLGLGYLTEKSPWGGYLIADYSGIVFNTGVQNYGSLETAATYRKIPSDRSEFRFSMGIFQREYPLIMPDPSSFGSGSSTTKSQYYPTKAAMMGPHGGVEYWYSISPKLGFQLNGHLYFNSTAMGKPEYVDQYNPTMAMTYGVMGSYRVNKKFTGLLGLTYKKESVDYVYNNPNTQSGTTAISTSITGTYFSLFAEYDF